MVFSFHTSCGARTWHKPEHCQTHLKPNISGGANTVSYISLWTRLLATVCCACWGGGGEGFFFVCCRLCGEVISIVYVQPNWDPPSFQRMYQQTHTRTQTHNVYAAESHLMPHCKYKQLHMTKNTQSSEVNPRQCWLCFGSGLIITDLFLISVLGGSHLATNRWNFYTVQFTHEASVTCYNPHTVNKRMENTQSQKSTGKNGTDV